jgi:para-aminobenzoate synthetase component 1
VHHLVSTVTGVLADGADAFDLLRAAFPGGSVTGAPKIRAMQIIAELEPAPRGLYCGAIGYIATSGAMDFNIPIRTIVLQGGIAAFHAGAGIVWDSDPAAEYQETLAKARTMIDALTSPRRTQRTRGRAHPPA